MAKYLAQYSLPVDDTWNETSSTNNNGNERKEVQSKLVRMEQLFPEVKITPYKPISQDIVHQKLPGKSQKFSSRKSK